MEPGYRIIDFGGGANGGGGAPSEITTSDFSGIDSLQDNTLYIVETGSNITIPTVPEASGNRQGITIQITATSEISIAFQTGYNPRWYGGSPDNFTITAGKTVVLFILDGIIAFSDVEVS